MPVICGLPTAKQRNACTYPVQWLVNGTPMCTSHMRSALRLVPDAEVVSRDPVERNFQDPAYVVEFIAELRRPKPYHRHSQRGTLNA